MKKKLLFSLIPATASMFLPVISASCNKEEYFKEVPMLDANGKEVPGRKTLTTLADIVSNPDFKLAEAQKNHRTVFITDEGSIEDKSFNQSGWEAVHRISYELGIDKAEVKGNKQIVNDYRQPEGGKLDDAYVQTIESRKYKYFVLCGFTHAAVLKQTIKDEKLFKIIKEENMKFICVDFAPADFENKDLDKKLKEYSIPVQFDTAIAGYIAGYALSNYFANKYPDKPEKRTIGAFGGIQWPAVSDFINGTFLGIRDANKNHLDKTTKSIKDKINLDSGFISEDPKATQAINDIKNAEAWYPVAGSLSVRASKEQKTSKSKFLIGVDADQALALPKARVYTSVMKLVGQAIYNVLGHLYTYGNVEKMPQFKDYKTTLTAKQFGYDIKDKTQRYVNVAKASLLNEKENEIANKTLDEARAYYEKNADAIIKAYGDLIAQYTPKGQKTEYPKIYQDIANGLAKEINEQK